ncbi:tRNA (adenosine(37)-N6)-threonylcarbamoyltransferase complex dimerization subunit type 1 TsaB [Marmoricola endophyticus]|uniref:tRNA (Adenosine(37)-N6)-threonylcarbamoyltransferase complex dimerization subunit type 1 TsaB n=1 Tax=Marmoricola endophyticus TaxID=2040280 RepID=A0A917BJ31_9ACTN|nr:tRNA (adenosine(37)-N6)-threonylcarbamoyltransferase complex dimerization subunit type 1 TsaB [Marmoricola endophyticus]GGF42398.1 tRNA (adenosine(37)-N6)-threonylcarbamoyltransferase complex dimerization subunit type 1 TsaB [Marmoricola endophyticus]
MLLGLDTATTRVTVALHDGERVVAQRTADEAMRHGELLAPAIEAVLAEVGALPSDVTAVAAGAGPGPFTGLRVGLVTARTMAFALGVPAYAVCTLDVLAAEAVDAGLEDFVVATDARRKEVYLAVYAGGVRTAGPVVTRPSDAATEALVVGRGGVLYPEAFPHRAGPELPSAAVLCDVVVGERYELVDPEPMYLRRPDAQELSPPPGAVRPR